MDKLFITKSDLKTKRNWTESLIKKYLKKPDLIKPNPYYNSASEMLLYDLKKIMRIEGKATFKEDFDKTLKRKSSSKKAIETKTNNLLSLIENIEITVIKMEMKNLYDAMIEDYNNYHLYKNLDSRYISISTDKQTLIRIAVNYIRHNLTSYDHHLVEIYSKVGTHQAYKILNKRIYDLISKTYPDLEKECVRQFKEKFTPRGYFPW